MTGLRYNERAFVGGPTESGKSELLNVLFSHFECQRLLYDSKGHEWTIEGVEPVSDPAAIDWTQPIIHYVTTSTDVSEVDAVFSQAERRVDLVVCVHELGDLCEYHTNKTPGSVNRYLAQGGANGRGFLGGSQVPADMPKRARTEVNRVYTMTPPMNDDEHVKVVARMAETTPKIMVDELIAVKADLGDHSFIEWPKGSQQEAVAWPPLPPEMLAQSIVQRRRPHARERSR